MDQGDGTFAPLPAALADALQTLAEKEPDATPQLWPLVFRVGEEVVIRRSRFRIETIGIDLLVLRLLPQTIDAVSNAG